MKNKQIFFLSLLMSSSLYSMEEMEIDSFESDLNKSDWMQILPSEVKVEILIKSIETSDNYSQAINNIFSLYGTNREFHDAVEYSSKYILKAISKKYGLIALLHLVNLHPAFSAGFAKILNDDTSVVEIAESHEFISVQVLNPKMLTGLSAAMAFNIIDITQNFLKFILNKNIVLTKRNKFLETFVGLIKNTASRLNLDSFRRHLFGDSLRSINFNCLGSSVAKPYLKSSWNVAINKIVEYIDSNRSAIEIDDAFASFGLSMHLTEFNDNDKQTLKNELESIVFEHYLVPILELSYNLLKNINLDYQLTTPVKERILQTDLIFRKMDVIKSSTLAKYVNMQKMQLIKFIINYNLKIGNSPGLPNEKSLFRLLMELDSDESINFLVSNGFESNEDTENGTLLYNAILEQNSHAVHYLLKEQLKLSNEEKAKCLMKAVESNDLEITTLLLRKGFNSNLKFMGKTPLMAASSPEIANKLLKHGAKIMKKKGRTLLGLAAQTNNLKMIQFWLNNQININETDYIGKTALMIVSSSPRTKLETVKFLVENGADMNLRDVRGHTALSLAKFHHINKIAQYLEMKGAVDRY